jgi:hypothetical protein
MVRNEELHIVVDRSAAEATSSGKRHSNQPTRQMFTKLVPGGLYMKTVAKKGVDTGSIVPRTCVGILGWMSRGTVRL